MSEILIEILFLFRIIIEEIFLHINQTLLIETRSLLLLLILQQFKFEIWLPQN